MNDRLLRIVLWVVLILSPALLLGIYFRHLWNLDQYQYFPVLIVTLLALIAVRWDGVVELPSRLGMIFLGIGLIVLWIGILKWSPWLGCLGWIWILGSWLISHQSKESSPALWTLWPAVWLLLRLPLNLDLWLTTSLQQGTAQVTSLLLDLLSIPNRLSGSVFTLSHGQLFVEEACSGVQSVFSLLFCSVLLVIWLHRSLLLLPLYLVASVVWAAAMNLFRVLAVAVAQEWYGIDLAHGWRHEALGYFCLAMAILLLASTDRAIRVLFYPLPHDRGEEKAYNPIKQEWNRIFHSMMHADAPRSSKHKTVFRMPVWAVTLCSFWALISLVPQVQGALRRETLTAVKIEPWKPIRDFPLKIAGISIEDFTQVDSTTDPSLGQYASSWKCRIGEIPFRIVVSQHAESHDLCSCYTGNGWRRTDRRIHNRPDGANETWSMVEATFMDAETNQALLLFSTLTHDNQPIEAKESNLVTILEQRTGDRSNRTSSAYTGEMINIQMIATSEAAFRKEQIEILQGLHFKLRESVRQDLVSQQIVRNAEQ